LIILALFVDKDPRRDETVDPWMDPELEEWCRDGGLPRFRADQIRAWLYVHRAADWDAMTNLPAALRAGLREAFDLQAAAVESVTGEPDGTRKLLVVLRDGERIEAVHIPAPGRRTACVSTQAGCGYACTFCASGQAGLRRNLEAGEIVGQVLCAAAVNGCAPTHVVFMGIGEPLDNYEAVLRAVRILNDGQGLNIGARRMTISTCGLIPGIRRLAAEGLQVELSVSLHAPTDELRTQLMPVNRLHPLTDLLRACRAYSESTNRIVTFEYTLIRGVNDAAAQARELVRVLAPLPCRVNLIPLSPVAEYAAAPSPASAARLFVRTLQQAGINATLRASRGAALKAACGQLRYRPRSRSEAR
jgi:23S rRNA (adenine2503-C2)-methyltransferase